MFGAIIGDMVGSIYEFHPIKRKDFNIYNNHMRMTDDSLLTIALIKTLSKHYPINYNEESLKAIQQDLAHEFVDTWKKYKGAGFGGMFYRWCLDSSKNNYIAPPYNSYGNGSAMRISPVGWVANNEDELKILSKIVTEITHNHPEGIKGAEAVAICIYMALHGSSKNEIEQRMIEDYYPEIATLDFDDLMKHYEFNETCQKSVPQAIYCFLISDSLEDTIRNCVAIGGDSDTTAAMAGAIAEAFYDNDKASAFEEKYLYLMVDPDIEQQVKAFYKLIGSPKYQ